MSRQRLTNWGGSGGAEPPCEQFSSETLNRWRLWPQRETPNIWFLEIVVGFSAVRPISFGLFPGSCPPFWIHLAPFWSILGHFGPLDGIKSQFKTHENPNRYDPWDQIMISIHFFKRDDEHFFERSQRGFQQYSWCKKIPSNHYFNFWSENANNQNRPKKSAKSDDHVIWRKNRTRILSLAKAMK